jgi:N-acetylglucosaminyltransferase
VQVAEPLEGEPVVEPSLYAVVALYLAIALPYLLLQTRHQSRRVAASAPRPLDRRWPSVDVVLPCYNEDPALLDACCASLDTQDYPGEFNVFLVDDGSSNRDALMDVYLRYQGRPRWSVHLLDRNHGKRRAQDVAVRAGDGQLVVTVDSDTVVEPDGVRRLVNAFADLRVGAVTGDVRVSNVADSWLTDLIDERYRLLFEQERAAQSKAAAVLCCSGPFSAYRRSIIERVWGDYLAQTFLGRACVAGDDLHLTVLVLAQGHRSLYEPSAKARTHVPETLGSYVRQQVRWNRSFYRELLPTLRLLPGRRPYITLDVAARLLLPLLLAGGTALATWQALTNLGRPSHVLAAAGAITVMCVSSAGLLASKSPRISFVVLYGLIYVSLLIPARLWALVTLRHDGWGTRRLSRPVWRRGAARSLATTVEPVIAGIAAAAAAD